MKNPSWLCQESVIALWGVRHGSRRSLSWLCEQSVMTLGGICHLWRLASASTGGAHRWRVCYQWGLPRLVFLGVPYSWKINLTSIGSISQIIHLLVNLIRPSDHKSIHPPIQPPARPSILHPPTIAISLCAGRGGMPQSIMFKVKFSASNQ